MKHGAFTKMHIVLEKRPNTNYIIFQRSFKIFSDVPVNGSDLEIKDYQYIFFRDMVRDIPLNG